MYYIITTMLHDYLSTRIHVYYTTLRANLDDRVPRFGVSPPRLRDVVLAVVVPHLKERGTELVGKCM